MARSLHELSPAAQATVFGLLCVLTIEGARQAAVGPLLADISVTRERLASLESEVLQAELVALRLPAAQREVRALEATLHHADAVTQEETSPEDVLRRLHELASESLLDIASFTPRPAVVRMQHTEWPIELGLEGRYHDLGRFLDRVAGMSRLLSISELQIRARLKPTGRGTVSASCVATAFVFEKHLAQSFGGS